MTDTPAAAIDMLVFRAAVHLITTTPGAATLADVSRIRGRSQVTLLAEETGMSADQVHAVIERNPADYAAAPDAS